MSESAIRGGSIDDGDPAVAALSVLGLYTFCTATLISKHTLLTAGHCNLDAIEADFGTDSDDPTQSIDIDDVAVHPMYGGEGKPYDFALMKLDSDPVGIAPIALNDAALAGGDIGRTIRHVGYGVTDDATSDGGGIKRTVSYPLHRIDAILVYSGAAGEQTCTGDSGGPGLMALPDQAEALVSVVSDGPDCQLSQDGWDDRVDLIKDWIVQTVGAWDAPPTFVAAATGATGSGSGTGSGPGTGGGPGDDSGAGAAGSGSDAKSGGCTAAPGTSRSALWLIAALAALARLRLRLWPGRRHSA